MADNVGRTPLHKAAATYGYGDAVKLLVAAWPEAASMADNGGRTPLHWSAAKGDADAAKLLLRAYPEAAKRKDDDGTPADLASKHKQGDWEAVVALLNRCK